MDTERYRTGLKRFWAAFVDGVVFLPLLLAELWIHKATNNISILFIWATFVSFTPPVYSVILHYKTGQTVGKWVAGVKVLDISEARKLTFFQSIYRDGFYLLVALIGLLYYGFLLTRTDGTIDILADYTNFSNMCGFWWILLEIMTMLTNSKRRALHDFIARSVVVKTGTNSQQIG